MEVCKVDLFMPLPGPLCLIFLWIQVKQDVYYQINILLAPYMVMLYTFLTTFLATALAEKQDALSLLKERNAQLLIQGRELEEARLAAQVS